MTKPTPAEVIAGNLDGMDIPECLRIPQEERRKAWADWDRERRDKEPAMATTKDRGIAKQVRALREARADGQTVVEPDKKHEVAAAAAASIEKPAADAAPPTPEQGDHPEESTMKTKSKSKAKAKTAAKPNKAERRKKGEKKAAARSPARGGASAEKKPGEVREGTKLAKIVELLKQPGGCTTKEILAATEWPSVSVPQQARLAGLELKKEKKDGVTYYSVA